MISKDKSNRKYILGLDIGSTSVGWACIETSQNKPIRVLVTGVRLFDAGMSGEFEKGKEASNAIERRKSRLARRQTHRKAVRRWKVFKLLQDSGLFPPFGITSLRELSPHIEKLDRELGNRYGVGSDHVSSQLLTYRIRERAANQIVPLHDLGRAIYHLAKRRGFNSNLRGTPKNDEDQGQIKSQIKSLATELESRSKTLGEYFASENPIEKRIRTRWTGRDMFLKEFDRIWDVQSKHHKELSEELYRKLRKAIFFQRPLRSAKGLVGKCSILKNKRRLIAAHPLAQEVRMLQFINNVRVCQVGEVDRQLTNEERDRAIAKLSSIGRMTIKQFRDCLDLPKRAKLNFDNDDDTHAHGMGTTSVLKDILGDLWESFDNASQEKLIHDVLSFNKRDALIRHLIRKWQINQEDAELLSELTLEPGYANHCRAVLEALRDLLSKPDATTGMWLTYSEAKHKAVPEAKISERHAILPPVRNAVSNLTNPSVIRSLTEVRKVVNELIGRYGIPSIVRIELARDLKKSKKERKRIEDLIREQTKKRRSALARIKTEFTGYPEKDGYDRGIEMVLLAEECNWQCPYTGEEIQSVRDLLGDNSRFDIEHIFPRRYLDDSFSNKTLCLNHENRNVKKDQLPSIAYSRNPTRYQEILDRVRRFRSTAASRKLERFMAAEVPNDFVSRQLDETRYMSRAAADYLGLLFGGRVDEAGQQRVFTVTGSLTSILRGQWRLNQILGLQGEKNRADHRHHAVDAIVIACTDMATVQALQKAASDGWNQGSSRRYPQIDPPFRNLLDEARESILKTLVSHRPNRKLNGPLHADSLYSVKKNAVGKFDSKSRKPLSALTETQIEQIVDERIKRIVRAKYEELLAVNNSPKKAGELFAPLENHPFIDNADGSRTPIHSVRIWENRDSSTIKQKTLSVRGHTRYVISTGGSNYCSRFYSILDTNGQEIGWKDRVLSRLEAMQIFGKQRRKTSPIDTTSVGLPVSNETVDTNSSTFDENLFVFDLFVNDFVLMMNNQNKLVLYRVLSLSSGDIEVRLHTDGRLSDAVKKSKERVRIGTRAITKREFRKVYLSPAGMVIDAISGEIIIENLA